MHVGFALLTLFPGRVGGSESYVRGLLGEFASGTGPDEVTVLANRHVMAAYGDVEGERVRLLHVASYRAGDRDTTRALAMAGAAVRPAHAARDVPDGLDLVHYPVTVPIPATRAPRVVTLYDVQHRDLPELFSRAERAYRRWAYDRAARNADAVVAVSEHARGRMIDLLGLDPERVAVSHLGIDTRRFSPRPGPEDDAVAERLRLPARFVVYPANLWPHKNHRRLLEAVARVPDPELHLVLSGQDYGRLGELRRRAEELGLGDRVRHLGHVPGEDLAVLYRRARALVFPSLYEGFGSPPLEAMSCRCPVACSSAASLPEICGGAALAFDPASVESIAGAIERVSADEGLRERLSLDGVERARCFTWRASAERHAAIYARVTATRGP